MHFDYYREEENERILLAQGGQTVMWVNQQHKISIIPGYLYTAIQEFTLDRL